MQQQIEESTPSFTRRSVMKAAGMATVGFGAIAVGAGTAAASPPCNGCVELGKIEGEPELKTYSLGKEDVEIEITKIEREDGEAVKFEWNVLEDSKYSICKVEVKGGPNSQTRCHIEGTYGAGSAWARAPDMHGNNPNRDYYGISNFTFYYCVSDDLPETLCDAEEEKFTVTTKSNGQALGKNKDD